MRTTEMASASNQYLDTALHSACIQSINSLFYADQLVMLGKYANVSEDLAIQMIDEILQAAEKHQDIFLLAHANYTRAFIMLGEIRCSDACLLIVAVKPKLTHKCQCNVMMT